MSKEIFTLTPKITLLNEQSTIQNDSTALRMFLFTANFQHVCYNIDDFVVNT